MICLIPLTDRQCICESVPDQQLLPCLRDRTIADWFDLIFTVLSQWFEGASESQDLTMFACRTEDLQCEWIARGDQTRFTDLANQLVRMYKLQLNLAVVKPVICQSLIGRYIQRQETVLVHDQIWICSLPHDRQEEHRIELQHWHCTCCQGTTEDAEQITSLAMKMKNCEWSRLPPAVCINSPVLWLNCPSWQWNHLLRFNCPSWQCQSLGLVNFKSQLQMSSYPIWQTDRLVNSHWIIESYLSCTFSGYYFDWFDTLRFWEFCFHLLNYQSNWLILLFSM